MFQIKVDINISDAIIKDVIDNMNDWCGLTLNEKHVQTILNKNLDISKDLEKMGGVDSLAREDLSDRFCRDVLDMFPWKWPEGRFTAEYKFDFYQNLIKKCKEKNIPLDFTEENLQEELKKWREKDEKRK